MMTSESVMEGMLAASKIAFSSWLSPIPDFAEILTYVYLCKSLFGAIVISCLSILFYMIISDLHFVSSSIA